MAKQYINLWPQIQEALGAYCNDVRAGSFPASEHEFAIDQSVVDQLKV